MAGVTDKKVPADVATSMEKLGERNETSFESLEIGQSFLMAKAQVYRRACSIELVSFCLSR